MSFDTTDLAIIETSLDVIEEPARDIIARLIEMVREHEAEDVKIEELEEKVLDLGMERDGYKEERDELQRDLDRMEKALHEAREEVRHLESRNEKLAVENDHLENRLEEMCINTGGSP